MRKVAIHGVPRSGTTWLANIFNSNEHVAYRQQPLFSYAFKGYLDEYSSTRMIENFFKEIFESDDPYLHQVKETKDGKVPFFEKKDISHLLYKEVRYHYVLDNLLANSEVHLFALIRNPLSTLHSFYNAPSEFKEDWEFEEEWLNASKKNLKKKENYFGYSKWKEVLQLFHFLVAKYGDERVTLVKYADLLDQPLKVTENLFKQVDLSITEQTRRFLMKSTSLKNSNAYSVFKVKEKDSNWKGFIPKEIENFIKRDLEGTLYDRYLE